MNQYFVSLARQGSAVERTHSRTCIRSFVLLLLFVIPIFTAPESQAQTSNEFFATSMGSIPSGPTAAPQTARLLLNSNNPAGDTIGATNINVSMTASLSNQQFTGFMTGTGNPVVMFGGTTGAAGGPNPVPAFGLMSSIGSPTSGLFSNTPSGTAQGLNVAVNHSFDFFTSVRQWATTPPPTSGRIHMADLTLTFSSPVTNPRLHFSGMGGNSSLTFSSEFTLITPGLTLTEIQGNTAFSVTATQVNNGSAAMAAACSGNAGCGTVTVNGSNITTITFQVFIRGDGGAGPWSTTTVHPGDRWMLAVSLPESYNLAGNVFNDIDGPGTINGTGISMPNGAQLFATLVDPSDNTVLGSIPVNPDGSYNFNGVPGGGVNYRVEISTTQGIDLSPAPARILPAGWNTVGENLGAGTGNDGTPDRALNLTVGTANVTNANFGISLAPSAANVGVSGRVVSASDTPISGAQIVLTDSVGNVRRAISSSLGYFSFEEVAAGQSYLLTASHRGYQFDAQVLTVHDTVTDLIVMAIE